MLVSAMLSVVLALAAGSAGPLGPQPHENAAEWPSAARAASNPVDWSADEIAGWLDACGFGEHAETFRANGVTGDILVALREARRSTK
jgi:hypothetical protein